MPKVAKHRSGITLYQSWIARHASLEREDIRGLPHILHRKTYTRPQRMVTPKAMTLRTREISNPLAITSCRLRRSLIAMSTGVGYQTWRRRDGCDKWITFQDEGSNTTNGGIQPQEYRQPRLINDAIEGLPRNRRWVKIANDHYHD